MERRALARFLRALRRRRGWTQRQLSARLGIGQQWMSRLERGDLRACSVPLLENWASSLGAYLVLDVRISGERPITDARHAAIQNWVAQLLRDAGWIVEVEVSFNDFGDRGRIDVLAFHPGHGILLIIEVKTRIDDVQDLLGRIDIKARVARKLAIERGWLVRGGVVPALLVREDRTSRRRITEHAALFGRHSLRARTARAWMTRPTVPAPSGILMFVDLPDIN
jgi:transcriptional regulator with XRE-family HTH domain